MDTGNVPGGVSVNFYKIFCKNICRIKFNNYLCIGSSKRPFWPVDLLVISFSVINYVVSKSDLRVSVDHSFFIPV